MQIIQNPIKKNHVGFVFRKPGRCSLLGWPIDIDVIDAVFYRQHESNMCSS